jgi:hypothetical protein
MSAYAAVLLILITSITSCSSPKLDNSPSLNLATFSAIGLADERYQSYNVEMAEVIGAKFWREVTTTPELALTEDWFSRLDKVADFYIQVVFHNTLASREYGLLDAHFSQTGLQLYAHCLPDSSGGVALLAINTNKNQIEHLRLGLKAERYTLSAEKLLDMRIFLNGQELKSSPNDDLPMLKSEALPAGQIELSPLTITFLVFRDVQNKGYQ